MGEPGDAGETWRVILGALAAWWLVFGVVFGVWRRFGAKRGEWPFAMRDRGTSSWRDRALHPASTGA